MKKLLPFLFIVSAYAQDPAPKGLCQAQLMRLQVDSNAISNLLQNNQEAQRRLVPAIQTYINSDTFRTSFITDYPLPSVGFPFSGEVCEREKAREPSFSQVDCKNWNLCGDPDLSEQIKRRICFALPCSFLMGNQMDRCPRDSSARPKSLIFTGPVSLKQLDMVPENVAINGNTVRSCFKINAMSLSLGVGIDFDKNGTDYPQIGLENLNVNLDSPRQICISANIDLTKSPVLSGVQIEHTSGGPFVSDAMIDRGLRSSRPQGLTGYSPETLEVLKVTAIPPLARHFRPAIENAIAKVLGSTFETKVSGYISALNNKSPTHVDTPSDSMVSELGVGNIAVKKYAELLDCAMKKRERVTIPADHACFTSLFPGRISNNYKLSNLPTVEKAIDMLSETMARNSNVTSESLQARLTGFQDRLKKMGLGSRYDRQIVPVINRITEMQASSTLVSGIELVSGLSNDSQLNVGVCLPETCDRERPSSHAGKNIPHCPIQTYVDINELNNLTKAMYESGRLCHNGRGDFVADRNARGEIVRENGDGLAQGRGCLFAVEEDPKGLRCYLNGPPVMYFDKATKRYLVNLKTKECFRGAAFAGQGKVGGDIDFTIGFTPSICNGGDFCLENGQAWWNVVPGTARYALRDSSFLKSIVKNRIDDNLKELVSSTLRFPLTKGQGPLSNVPIEPDGRVDTGDGYFGACLKIRSTGSARAGSE